MKGRARGSYPREVANNSLCVILPTMKNSGAATLSISALLATLQACTSALPCPAPVTPVQVAAPAPPPLAPVHIEFEGLQLTVQSLQVSASRPSADAGRFIGARGFWSQTKLEFLVADAEARLIGVAPESTRLDACEDETGEPLALRGPGSAGPQVGWDQMGSVSTDRSVMVVNLACPGSATPGAREVRVRGRLGVVLGGNRATATGTLELRAGQTLTLGDVELSFRSVRPGDTPGNLWVDFDAPGGSVGSRGSRI